MTNVESIANRVEAKLKNLEAHHAALADRIRSKRAQIRELENTLEKLRRLQSKLS